MASKHFYIDLDFIFDTRISVLHKLDPNYLKKEFDQKKYRNRTNDRFATETTPFTHQEWLDAWNKRDLEILQNSIVTNGVKTLHETIASIDWGIDPSDISKKVTVTVNCWPYKELSDGAKQEICNCIRRLCPMDITVGSCYVPPEHLFLKEASDQYDLMFHYNPFAWLRFHEKDLEQHDMVSLWIVAPALLWGDESTEINNPLLKNYDPFTLTEMFCSSKFTLRYIPVSDVCLLKPKGE